LPALQVAWELEARGLTLKRDGASLVVRPASGLTAADRAMLRRHRDALLALVAYCEGVQ
jgi:hypothetical protein